MTHGQSTVGERILGHRQRAGLTQEQLALRSGLSTRMVRDLERNRVTAPRASSVRQLATALRLSEREAALLASGTAGTAPPAPDLTSRLLDHYLSTGVAAARRLDPHREPPAAGAAGETIAVVTDAAARGWFAAEHDVLLAVAAQAIVQGRDGDIRRLAWLLRDHLDRRGHWARWLVVEQAALAAAERQGDEPGRASVLRSLGRVCERLTRYGDAAGHLRQARELSVALGDGLGQAHALVGAARFSPPAEALSHALTALGLYRRAGHDVFAARTLAAVAAAQVRLGRQIAALASFRQALRAGESDPAGLAAAWAGLGGVHHRLGELAEAARCLHRALALHDAAQDLLAGAMVRAALGDVHHAAARRPAALAAWQSAAATLDRLGHPQAVHVRNRQLAPAVRKGSLPVR